VKVQFYEDADCRPEQSNLKEILGQGILSLPGKKKTRIAKIFVEIIPVVSCKEEEKEGGKNWQRRAVKGEGRAPIAERERNKRSGRQENNNRVGKDDKKRMV